MTAITLDPVGGLRTMLGLEFMQHAFIAGTAIAVAAGVVGYFVVLRNQVFTGDALSHVAFTGSLAALCVGIDPLIGLFGTTVAMSAGLGALGGRARARDVVIGTVFAWILGLGVLFLSIYTTTRSGAGGAAGVNVLFGSIYGISTRQTAVAAAVGVAAAVAVAGMARPLLFASVDPDVAAARGIAVDRLGLLFLAVVGVTVAEAVQAVGALLIVGLLATPAATAQRLTARPFAALWLSATLALGAMWSGLTLAYSTSTPPSFCVVAVAFGAYVLVTTGSAVRRRVQRGGGRPYPHQKAAATIT